MNIREEFELYLNVTDERVSAAILVLAGVIQEKGFIDERLGHEISMGIRHGIFGSNANNNATIDNTFSKND